MKGVSMYYVMLHPHGLDPVEVASRMYFNDALDYVYFTRQYLDCDMLIYHRGSLIASILSS